MTPLLTETFPFDHAFIRRFELARRMIDTVAEEHPGGKADALPSRTPCAENDLEEALTWCRQGDPLLEASDSARMAILAPRGARGQVLAVPIGSEEDGAYAVLLMVFESTAPHPSLVDRARALIEPLRLALANDRRHHELVRLREAVEADNRALLSRLERQDISETIVGETEGLREVMERIAQVAPTDVPVLILGETGTGKEVVARTIHARSHRAKGPMARVNCGAIPAGLVDSELFGHERGSFTGAVTTRQGWFERADGGTLFLDEIGELSLEAQVRLLRVLQEGVLERVGAAKSIHVDVRIVAATHRDLEDMVREGKFREDLWYRISVFPVSLPPLRERRADVPALAAHFAWRAGKRLGGAPLAPSSEDIGVLLAYDWPGNVRELAAVIERAAILGNGKRLDVSRALGVRSTPSRPPSMPPPPAANTVAGGDFATLDTAIARHIEAALTRTGGRIEGKGGAAELLDINPHTLRSRMRKLGLEWSRYRRD